VLPARRGFVAQTAEVAYGRTLQLNEQQKVRECRRRGNSKAPVLSLRHASPLRLTTRPPTPASLPLVSPPPHQAIASKKIPLEVVEGVKHHAGVLSMG
jgi:hypothetical protein